MGLTVAEKNHWKERIQRKLDRAIEVLLAANDPTYKAQLAKDSRVRAMQSLEIEESMNRIAEIKRRIDELTNEQHDLYSDIDQRLNTDVANSWRHGTEERVKRVIKDRQELCEIELMNETPLGQQVLKLKREQDELLDTVWLATSPVQITNLWSRVVALLGESLTDLQQETLQSLTSTQVASD